MQGYSPKLPLSISTEGIFSMNTSLQSTIAQDLKMLLLTSPGERVMMPQYGVGLRRYLFEQGTQENISNIKNKIYSQINKYMRFININNIEAGYDDLNENVINIKISYSIPQLNTVQELNINADSI